VTPAEAREWQMAALVVALIAAMFAHDCVGGRKTLRGVGSARSWWADDALVRLAARERAAMGDKSQGGRAARLAQAIRERVEGVTDAGERARVIAEVCKELGVQVAQQLEQAGQQRKREAA